MGKGFDWLSKNVRQHNDDCLIWPYGKNSAGYGYCWINGKQERAHRAAYEIVHGELPPDLFVCHRCDNPSCVNPEHLFLGTPQQNSNDMKTKGRCNSPKGTENGHAKLAEKDVLKIRKDNRSQYEIAAEYKVDQALISRIKSIKIWKHVP